MHDLKTRDAPAAYDARPGEVSYSKPDKAAQLRELITRTGKGQRWVAEQLGVDVRTLRYWTAGDDKRGEPPNMVFLAIERLIDLQHTVQR